MQRVSQKIVNSIINAVDKNLRLVSHQNLGDRKNYYYTYSLVRDEDNKKAVEKILEDKTLKEVYNYVSDLLSQKCDKMRAETQELKESEQELNILFGEKIDFKQEYYEFLMSLDKTNINVQIMVNKLIMQFPEIKIKEAETMVLDYCHRRSALVRYY
jgi:hypothetical protein